MAIQVSGTEVISNSRVLSNVTGLKTVGGTAILGSGDIAVGGSTTFGAVGTYAMLCSSSARANVVENTAAGATFAGSGLHPIAVSATNFSYLGFAGDESQNAFGGQRHTDTVSGTWRKMSPTITNQYMGNPGGVFVRIS